MNDKTTPQTFEEYWKLHPRSWIGSTLDISIEKLTHQDAWLTGQAASADEIARLNQCLNVEKKLRDDFFAEWKQEVESLLQENERLKAALEKIANIDYRGNRSTGSEIAWNTLKALYRKPKADGELPSAIVGGSNV